MLGPLAVRAEPHGYDLCQDHARSLSAPRGWEVIRLAADEPARPSTDDLLALADAVREVGLSYDPLPGPGRDSADPADRDRRAGPARPSDRAGRSRGVTGP